MGSKEMKETIRCKGAVCWGAGEPLSVEEIEVEPPKAQEVRVRMLIASLCHTDILRWKGVRDPLFPRILGHEGVGIVESIGESVEDLKEGDMVIPCFIGECGECRNCKSDRTNICEKYPATRHGLMPDLTSRMSTKLGQKKLYHMFSCSTFTQFMVVNCNYVIKVDPTISLSDASLLSCGFSTGYGMVWKEAKVEKGSSVAVFGLGGVGMGAINAAKSAGASMIIGVDLNERKKLKAQKFGMTDFINPVENGEKAISELIREMTGGFGVDYSFECTGAGPLIKEALDSTVMGRGVTIVVGATAPKNVAIDPEQLLMGKTLKGSIFGGLNPRSDVHSIVVKCIDKEIQLDEMEIQLDEMVTHQVDFENINQAFELQKEPDCLKVVISINQN